MSPVTLKTVGHFGGISRMPFTAHDLRYQAEQNYPLLYAYLHRNAQRFLGALKYDAFEVDTVIGHVVEQLVRLGLLGGGDHTPLTALDSLTDAQFYAFLGRSVRNKAIDRLRKRRLQVSASAELEAPDDESENNPLDDAVESVWGTTPFATPEAITVQLASQKHLRDVLKHCIMVLSAAPNQLQAVIQELKEIGADDLLQDILTDLQISLASEINPHVSQHKDHAHKKLRSCLQQQSSNLTVIVALRLTQYKAVTSARISAESTEKVSESAKNIHGLSTDLYTLAQQDLSLDEVREGLAELAREGLINWRGEDTVQLTADQVKHLSRFYKEE
jgi:DNA-directed RNA polymerase specialized sigma24 family protein